MLTLVGPWIPLGVFSFVGGAMSTLGLVHALNGRPQFMPAWKEPYSPGELRLGGWACVAWGPVLASHGLLLTLMALGLALPDRVIQAILPVGSLLFLCDFGVIFLLLGVAAHNYSRHLEARRRYS